jgi:formyltetrahydrofolate deformylase
MPRADDRHPEIGRLPIPRPGRPGIAAAVSNFPFASGANITGTGRYCTDTFGGIPFLWIRFHLAGLTDRFDNLAGSSGEPTGRFPMRGNTIVST